MSQFFAQLLDKRPLLCRITWGVVVPLGAGGGCHGFSMLAAAVFADAADRSGVLARHLRSLYRAHQHGVHAVHDVYLHKV